MVGNRLLESSPDPSPGKVTFQEADFFSLSASDEEKFDLVYDYTYVEVHNYPKKIGLSSTFL